MKIDLLLSERKRLTSHHDTYTYDVYYRQAEAEGMVVKN